jgi:hypothetical protein
LQKTTTSQDLNLLSSLIIFSLPAKDDNEPKVIEDNDKPKGLSLSLGFIP